MMIRLTFFFVLLSFRDIFVISTPLLSDSNSANLFINGTNNALACPTDYDQRSIQEIIWGCLATIFACAWFAVHPNMASPDAKWWEIGLIRLELMLWTILMPELVIYWAIRQWIGARKVERRYKDKGWTKAHGYFMQMGGFMLFEGTANKGVLTPRRFGSLLYRGEIVFPRVTEAEIQDRSKGDWLSKSLVIAQTTWFIAQFIARVAQGLTVSELELVTLAFAALNGFMYFFWWNKPLDARSPIAVYRWHLYPTGRRDDRFDGNHKAHTTADGVIEKLVYNERLPLNINESIKRPVVKIFRSLTSAFKITVLERMQLIDTQPDNLLVGKMRVPIFFASAISSKYDRLITMPVTIIGMMFGAIHCIAWNFTFPSTIEGHIWRIASLIVIGGPAIFLVFIAVASLIGDVFGIENNRYVQIVHNSTVVNIILVLFFCAGFHIYLFARLFLVVEAFVALRNLPLSARSIVKWTTFLPHV